MLFRSLQKYLDAQRRSKGRDAYQLLADVLLKLNRGDELVSMLQDLAAKDEYNVPLQFFLAERLYEVNELDKSRQIYEAMIPRSTDMTGYLGLIRVLHKLSKPQELLDLLERAANKLGQDGLVQLYDELDEIAKDANIVDLLIAEGRSQAKSALGASNVDMTGSGMERLRKPYSVRRYRSGPSAGFQYVG